MMDTHEIDDMESSTSKVNDAQWIYSHRIDSAFPVLQATYANAYIKNARILAIEFVR
jgi:hypothetical protein